MCVLQWVEANEALFTLRQNLLEKLGRGGGEEKYRPHLSLVYGVTDFSTRSRLALQGPNKTRLNLNPET